MSGLLVQLYDAIFPSRTSGGLVACTAPGNSDQCSLDDSPDAADAYVDPNSQALTSQGLAEYGKNLTVVLPSAWTCSGDTSGIEVYFTGGGLVNRRMSLDSDGFYSITFAANYSGDSYTGNPRGTITIRDLNRGTSTEKLVSLPQTIPSSTPPGPDATCGTDSSPSFVGSDLLNIHPDISIEEGETLIVSLPLARVEECDGSSDDLAARVLVSGGTTDESFTATLNNNYHSAEYGITLSGQHFVLERPFNTPGTFTVQMEISDTSRPGAPVILTDSNTKVYVSDVFCSDPPQPDAPVLSPNLTNLIHGDNTTFTWTVNDLDDCEDNDVNILSENVADILENGSYTYNMGVLTVTGQLKPSKAGSPVKFTVQDSSGNIRVISLWPPTILPVEIAMTSLFSQVDTATNFSASIVPDATNYRFWVTMPGDIDSPHENHNPLTDPDFNDYSYTPTVVGAHMLHLQITTFNGDIITVTRPFIPAAASAPTEEICYTPPTSMGVGPTSPLLSSIIRGDGTPHTWNVSGIVDSCFGNDLTPVDDNVSAILYNQSVSYSGGALTVSGSIRTLTPAGSVIRLRYIDNWGHMATVSLYLTTIEEPEIVADLDPWIEVSENAAVELLTDPAYCDFNWQVTRPVSGSFSSGLLTSSYWLINSSQKQQVGVYNLDLTVTGDDSASYHVFGSLPVHEDPPPTP